MAHVRETTAVEVHTSEHPFLKPSRFNSKLGLNAIISCSLDNVYPKKPLRDYVVNDYVKRRMKFRVVGLQKKEVGSGKMSVVLLLEFLHKDGAKQGPPDVPGRERVWWIAHTKTKLTTAGPPNQLFFLVLPKRKGKQKRGRSSTSATASGPDQRNVMQRTMPEPERGEDYESGAEDAHYIEEQDAPTNTRAVDPRYNIRWNEAFQSEMTIDGRGGIEERPPRMAGVDDASTLTPLEFFRKFFPYKYLKEHLIPATDKQLDEMGYEKTSVPEFEG